LIISGDWKTASEVREMLVSSGYNLSSYANASAAINTILNRLHKKGDVGREEIHGTIHFRWIATRNAVKKALLEHRRKK
jgi:predicted transcriptional regulator